MGQLFALCLAPGQLPFEPVGPQGVLFLGGQGALLLAEGFPLLLFCLQLAFVLGELGQGQGAGFPGGLFFRIGIIGLDDLACAALPRVGKAAAVLGPVRRRIPLGPQGVDGPVELF